MNERRRILESIEAGEISVEEAARRLEALSGPVSEEEPGEAPATPITPPAWVRAVWQIVLGVGIAMLAGGGYLLAVGYTVPDPAGRLTWGWLLVVLGVLGVMLGWWLPQAHWLAVRVREPGGPNVRVALPLPLGPVAWLLRVVAPFVPQLRETGVDEVILALREELRAGRPFVVQVKEGEGGEDVEVYFV